MGRWSRIWLYCISDGVPKRSLVVALIVGTILNLINQGDALVAGARLNLTKLGVDLPEDWWVIASATRLMARCRTAWKTD